MKSVLITGANKGLGLETAKYMLRNNYFVYLGCRNKILGELAIAQLYQQGLNNCELLEIDIADQYSIDSAAKKFTAEHRSLDVLINNAAILGRVADVEHPLNIEDVIKVFETNLFGTIRTTEAFLPSLKRADQPRIVNVTSTLASLTYHQNPEWELYKVKSITYGPSKTALNAYTVALAYQLQETNFKVNCVTPGYTSTDLNGHSGGKSPEENCKIIARYAMLDDQGPTGKYFGEHGELPW